MIFWAFLSNNLGLYPISVTHSQGHSLSFQASATSPLFLFQASYPSISYQFLPGPWFQEYLKWGFHSWTPPPFPHPPSPGVFISFQIWCHFDKYMMEMWKETLQKRKQKWEEICFYIQNDNPNMNIEIQNISSELGDLFHSYCWARKSAFWTPCSQSPRAIPVSFLISSISWRSPLQNNTNRWALKIQIVSMV